MKLSESYSSYWVRALNGMGLGLFSSLIVGLILKQAGVYLGIGLLVKLGATAQYLMGPAIAAGVARGIDAPPLSLLSVLVAGAVGAGTIAVKADGSVAVIVGEPLGAAVAALIGAQAGKFAAGRGGGSLDILIVPLVTITAGGLAGIFFAPYAAEIMKWIGGVINAATVMHPFMMGIIVSSVMGVVLTLPISSAALAMSLGLSGLAAGASTVGCSCQMIGFAVMSYRENGVGGLISQGFGTSMIQMPNIVKNPWIWLPPTLASAVLGPVSTMLFMMENSDAGAGMGTSGLVGQIQTFAVMGNSAWPGVIALHFVLPAALSCAFAEALRGKGLIKPPDMLLKHD